MLFRGFEKMFWKHCYRLKIRFSAQMSNNAKKKNMKHPENTNLTCFEAFQEFLENLVLGSKIRFSAQMSNNAKKIHWNTHKTPTKHVLRLFEKLLKIRFSAQKCGSQHRFRTMLKYLETLRKHQLNMFWGFLRNFWKSGSRLKNPVLGPDVEQC